MQTSSDYWGKNLLFAGGRIRGWVFGVKGISGLFFFSLPCGIGKGFQDILTFKVWGYSARISSTVLPLAIRPTMGPVETG
jgi:hypothetical protein